MRTGGPSQNLLCAGGVCSQTSRCSAPCSAPCHARLSRFVQWVGAGAACVAPARVLCPEGLIGRLGVPGRRSGAQSGPAWEPPPDLGHLGALGAAAMRAAGRLKSCTSSARLRLRLPPAMYVPPRPARAPLSARTPPTVLSRLPGRAFAMAATFAPEGRCGRLLPTPCRAAAAAAAHAGVRRLWVQAHRAAQLGVAASQDCHRSSAAPDGRAARRRGRQRHVAGEPGPPCPHDASLLMAADAAWCSSRMICRPDQGVVWPLLPCIHRCTILARHAELQIRSLPLEKLKSPQ